MEIGSHASQGQLVITGLLQTSSELGRCLAVTSGQLPQVGNGRGGGGSAPDQRAARRGC